MKSRPNRKKIANVAVAVATIATVATTATSFPSTSVMTTSPYFSQSKTKPIPVEKPKVLQMTPDHDSSSSSSSSHHKSNQDKKPINDITPNRKTTRTAATTTPRTRSFGALWAGTISNGTNDTLTSHVPQVHTLILGTHPSIKSLGANQYFAHPMNAFWWIAGDCLGFRRDAGLSSSSSKNKPYKFTSSLRHDAGAILPYDSQVRLLTSKGFALWDVVASCERKGSLDSAIKREVANDIRGFCEEHRASLKRIVFANGKSGCGFFVKHFKDWWSEDGELMPETEDGGVSSKAFGKKYGGRTEGRIRCVAALAVSPAAATYTYEEKRDYWERFCYQPGLDDHYRLEMMSSRSSK